MSVIVNITHEVGDLTEYASTITDGGDLSVTAAAALVGSYGLQCVLDDTNEIRGQTPTLTNSSGKVRARFYIDPNSLAMANSDRLYVLRLVALSSLCNAQLYYTTADGYQIYGAWVNDTVTQVLTSPYAITDAPHYVEMYETRATTNVSVDGTYTLWIDNVQKFTKTDIDNYDQFSVFAYAQLGPAGIDAGTSGTFFLDALVVNDDGGLIGGQQYTLAMDQGSFALDGQLVSLIASRLLAADQGAFTLAGQDIGLLVSRLLAMDQGAFVLGGQDVGLVAARVLALDQGNFVLAGQDLGLLAARLLTIDQGNFSLTGQDVGLLAARILPIGMGEFILDGQDVTLTYTPVSGPTYTLVMDQGDFALSGQAVGLLASRLMTMGQGAYVVTGYDLLFSVMGYVTAVDHGAFIILRDKRAVRTAVDHGAFIILRDKRAARRSS